MEGQVIIRVDGSAEIGLGHIVRCISLAHMLKNDFEVSFYSEKMPDSIGEDIKQEGWEQVDIKSEEEFISSLKGSEIVVLDGYRFDTNYQKKIKERGSTLVCIDDFHGQHFFADLVINHAPGVTEDNYEGESYTKYLLGPDYALLRPEFLESADLEKEENRNEIKNLFICFGGSDYKNLTCKILDWIPNGGFDITVVVGNKYQYYNDLYKVIEQRSGQDIHVKSSLTAREMREEMLKADLGVMPASGVLLEFFSVKKPAISGYYADNQIGFYEWAVRNGLVFDSKSFEKQTFKKIFLSISYTKCKDLITNLDEVIDRKSGQRLKTEFININ